MRVGRTISEERERIESESDRLAARELKKQREAVQTAILVVSVVALGILGVISVKNVFTSTKKTDGATVEKTYQPSVEIIDESGAKLSRKMSEFIGMVEEDFKDLDFVVTRVAIPAGLMREVDVYIRKNDGGNGEGGVAAEDAAGNGELPYYFKMNIDRGSAVSAEDAVRMVRYLEAQNLAPAYVDVRVEGKAFYR